jgi:F-type H+-transporting ATPase subunit b
MSFNRFLRALLLTLALVGLSPAVGCGQEHEPEHIEADAGHGGEEHPTGPPLSYKGDLALWSGVTFVIFLFVLGAMAWKPLIAGLDQREARIRHDIMSAESARVKAEQMLADHEQRLNRVQDEVREIIAEARRDADHTKQEIIAEAQKEAEATKRRAITEIQQARDTALKDLFDTMSSQVANATEHVLSRALTDGDQSRLIDEALAQFRR